jgi:hypothetical protein
MNLKSRYRHIGQISESLPLGAPECRVVVTGYQIQYCHLGIRGTLAVLAVQQTYVAGRLGFLRALDDKVRFLNFK